MEDRNYYHQDGGMTGPDNITGPDSTPRNRASMIRHLSMTHAGSDSWSISTARSPMTSSTKR